MIHASIRKRRCFFICLFFCVFFLFRFRVYASDVADKTKSLFSRIAESSTSLRSNFYVPIGNEPNETTLSFLNENGEVEYYGKNTKDTRSECIDSARYIDENGQLLPIGALDSKWKEKADAYENGNAIYLDADEIAEFTVYYSQQYLLYTQNMEDLIGKGQSDGTYRYVKENPTPNRNEQVKNQIIETFGIPSGEDDLDILYNTLCKLKETISYDLDYELSDMETCLQDRKGVCWHYSKIASTLLRAAGIECELITGKMNGEHHIWIRSKINGKWIYSDPTTFTESNVSNGCINYSTYLIWYTPYTTLPDVEIDFF